MMKKRLISSILLALVLTTLVACGNQDKMTDETNQANNQMGVNDSANPNVQEGKVEELPNERADNNTGTGSVTQDAKDMMDNAGDMMNDAVDNAGDAMRDMGDAMTGKN